MPTDEGPRLRRSHYAILGAAGIVTATVFAVVASLASRPANHVQPVPDLPGPVIGGSSTGQPPVIVTTTQATSVTVVAPPATPTTVRSTTVTPTTKPGPKSPAVIFAVSCTATACTFDGSGSTDPDGTIVYWAWSFGDNAGANGQRLQRVTHTYRNPGTYAVVLVVMDNDGKVGQASSRITVTR